MTNSLLNAAVFAAALGSGLLAGLFFVFSAFMMTALARLGAPQGIAAMQSVNVAILNPLFLIVFMGTAVLSLVTAVGAIWNWSAAGSGWTLAGSLLYLVGIILVNPGDDGFQRAAQRCACGRRSRKRGGRDDLGALSRCLGEVEPRAHGRRARRAGLLHSGVTVGAIIRRSETVLYDPCGRHGRDRARDR